MSSCLCGAQAPGLQEQKVDHARCHASPITFFAASSSFVLLEPLRMEPQTPKIRMGAALQVVSCLPARARCAGRSGRAVRSSWALMGRARVGTRTAITVKA